MYKIKKCSEMSDSQTHKAFSDGFADYMIKINMDEETFFKFFFGPEGNDRDLSYIALKNDVPVGVVLGGIKVSEEIKTLRCGGMAVIPSERGTGLAQELMKFHEAVAIKNECRQLFLEVIENNHRAVKFYKKLGYEKVYNLTYRKWELNGENPLQLKDNRHLNKVESMAFDDIYSLRNTDYSHLPWQVDFAYFKDLPCNYYGIKENDTVIAGLVATKTRIGYLWVHPNYRLQGYATALLNRAISELEPDTMSMSYANNSQIHTFANHLNMSYSPITQLEMYKWLG